MNGTLALEQDHDMLQRILARLLSLAALAERTSARSRSVCLLVLRFLIPAEAIARAFVMDTARDFGAPIMPRKTAVPAPAAARYAGLEADTGANPDAVRVAQSFHELARLVEKILRRLAAAVQIARLRAAGGQGGKDADAAGALRRLHCFGQAIHVSPAAKLALRALKPP